MAASGTTDRPLGNRAGKEGKMRKRMAYYGIVAAAIIFLTWISAGGGRAPLSQHGAEGALLPGWNPAGRDRGPAIPAADRALETGNPKPVLALIEEKIHEGIHRYYTEAMERKKHAGESVEAGRAYVQAYAPFLHFVERLY